MVGWMKTLLGTEVNLGQGHIVLHGVPAPAKGAQQPPSFRPCLLWPRSSISATVELLLAYFTQLEILLLQFTRWYTYAARLSRQHYCDHHLRVVNNAAFTWFDCPPDNWTDGPTVESTVGWNAFSPRLTHWCIVKNLDDKHQLHRHAGLFTQ